MKNEKNHYGALDGIRGLGILLVTIAHFRLFYLLELVPNSTIEKIWLQIADFNWVTMEWFFAMSGFLITGILLASKKKEGYFKNFFMRRFLRIFPLYYGFLAVYFLVMPRFMDMANNPESAYSFVSENQAWYWSYMANYLLALQGTWLGEMSHFWSLSVEEHFYLFWPFMVYFLAPKTLLRVSAVMIAASVALRAYFIFDVAMSPISVYVMTITRMDSLLMGSMLAMIASQTAKHAGDLSGLLKLRAPLTWASAIFAPMLVWFYAREGHFAVAPEMLPAQQQGHLYSYVVVYGYAMTGVMSAALIVWLLTGSERGWLRRVFDNRLFSSLGQYSYGMYIIHFAVFGLFHQSPLSAAALSKSLGSREVAAIVAFTVPFVATYAGAWAIWHGYEKHFLKLKKYFETGSSKKARAAAPAVAVAGAAS